MAAALQPDDADFDALRTQLLDRLAPVCARLLAADVGEIGSDVDACELMRAIGNFCVGATTTLATTPVA